MNNFKYQIDTFLKIVNMFGFQILSITNSEIICEKDDLTLTMTAFKTVNGIACTAKLFSKCKNITLGLPYQEGSCNQKQYRLVESYLVSDVSRMIDAIKLCDADGHMEMEITRWKEDSDFGFAGNIYIPQVFIHISQIPIEYREKNMKGFKFEGKYISNDTRGPKITEVKNNSGYFNLEILVKKELADVNILKELTEHKLLFILRLINEEQAKQILIYTKIHNKSVIKYLQQIYKSSLNKVRSEQRDPYLPNSNINCGF